MRIDQLPKGLRVYWLSAVTVKTGVILGRQERPRPTVLIEVDGGGYLPFDRLDELHASEHLVWIARGMECQRQAAELLAEANTAFKAAGVEKLALAIADASERVQPSQGPSEAIVLEAIRGAYAPSPPVIPCEEARPYPQAGRPV